MEWVSILLYWKKPFKGLSYQRIFINLSGTAKNHNVFLRLEKNGRVMITDKGKDVNSYSYMEISIAGETKGIVDFLEELRSRGFEIYAKYPDMVSKLKGA